MERLPNLQRLSLRPPPLFQITQSDPAFSGRFAPLIPLRWMGMEARHVPHRYQIETRAPSRAPFPIATALRKSLAQGYRAADLRADFIAGITVGIVALPLSMALAIASGVPPQHGLYTAIVAGMVVALTGGSSSNVSGPTAAFVVILAPIAQKFGVGGLVLATLMAGLMLLAMGIARFGRLIQFIPYPVTTGFTAGIAVVIATLQVRDFMGLTVAEWPEHYHERVIALAKALPTVNLPDLTIGLLSLALLIGIPRLSRRLPAPLIATAGAAAIAWFLLHQWPEMKLATIGNRFSYFAAGEMRAGIPPFPPLPVFPWSLPGPDGPPLELSFSLIRALAGPALAIAVLGAIESLLCAVVADGMAGKKHDPDGELIGQGLGNVIAPFFGGIAATGAIARTATSIRAGARSPLAPVFHSLFILASVVTLAPALAWLPMASMAALLLIVAWNMSEVKHFSHILRVGPRSDMLVLLTCFGLTVIFDMVIAVSIGIVLAALLFMRRMSEISGGQMFEGHYPHLDTPLPEDVLLYEIAGPLFFGATEKAVSALQGFSKPHRVVILEMSSVPAMDVTGLVALESAVRPLLASRVRVILAGVRPQPARVLEKSDLQPDPGRLDVCTSLAEAIALLNRDAPARVTEQAPG